MVQIVEETGVGLANANSYASLQFAEDYFDSHAYSTWDDLLPEVKPVLLIHATRMLDLMFSWQGWPSTTIQSLDWPRSGFVSPRGEEIPLNAAVVPARVRQATCELAMDLVRGDVYAPQPSDGLEELRVDVIQLKFDEGFRRTPVPPIVIQLLVDLGVYRYARRVQRAEVR